MKRGGRSLAKRSDRSGKHVSDTGPDIGPYARAIEWVAKITTVGLMMTLPVVAGRYFDQRWGTNYWVLVGLAAGVTSGMWQLVQMTRPKKGVKRKNGDSSGA